MKYEVRPKSYIFKPRCKRGSKSSSILGYPINPRPPAYSQDRFGCIATQALSVNNFKPFGYEKSSLGASFFQRNRSAAESWTPSLNSAVMPSRGI
ncbi:uncharacterized protein L3040_007977 [Drepanopeziza brunnea f. sp. 'multigermtubi']|uniref:uncharacterized protein n=1 Tax=Drepanopeziza brunnea f. sp. 'multigermtubi' TaxID=698441 RepID=UPI0023912A39|nr:hypothetical protein L3040_007977 [Drepanopeziza brunnea f. sp. 'multigermtubi']